MSDNAKPSTEQPTWGDVHPEQSQDQDGPAGATDGAAADNGHNPTQWAVRLAESSSDEPGEFRSGQRSALGSLGRWRRLAIGGGSALASLGLIYGVAYATAGNGVPRGTTVLGVEIGGLSPTEAEQRLANELPPLVDTPIAIQVGEDGSFEIVPSEAGLSIDTAATVAAAGGGGADPASLFQRLFGGGPVEPVVAVDRAALTQTMEGIAERTNSEPVDGAISFENGEPVVAEAQDGVALEVAAAGEALVAAFPNSTGPIELPIQTVAPSIGQDEVQRALTEFAQPAMSGLVTLRAEGKTATVGPKQLSKALTLVPTNGRLEPKLDGEKLADVAAEDLAELGQPGRDATVVIEGGRPVVVPHRPGTGVTPEGLAEAVLPALTKTGSDRVAEVTLEKSEPKLTTEQANQLGVKRKVSSFTTYFPHADYRNVNIGRAAALIDNTLLKPGDTFSLNGIVGERTAANGFTEGGVIKGGRLRIELGGGVSQVATTTFNAAWEAGLEDVEHRAHGLYFDRYPMGREATVYWPSLDLKFKNNTPYGVVVDTVFRKSTPSQRGSLTVNIWSTPYWSVKSVTSDPFNFTPYGTIYDSGDDCVPQTGSRGFDVTVTRTRSHGDIVKTDKLFHRYKPTDQIYCRAKPTAEPTDPEPDGG